jgi:Protein of unknown function (DUF2934)
MPTIVDNANVVNRPKDNQNNSERSPSHEEVAELARKLCHERGEGDGHAEEDWVRAEKQLADRAH